MKNILSKKDRKTIINSLDNVSKLFTPEVVNRYLHSLNDSNRLIFLRHYCCVLHTISEKQYINKSDFSLIMFCGVIDNTFCAGNSPYTKEQNIAINNMLDTIFQMKCKHTCSGRS
jgi:hypothetical protein